jgi:hypothetical protein
MVGIPLFEFNSHWTVILFRVESTVTLSSDVAQLPTIGKLLALNAPPLHWPIAFSLLWRNWIRSPSQPVSAVPDHIVAPILFSMTTVQLKRSRSLGQAHWRFGGRISVFSPAKSINNYKLVGNFWGGPIFMISDNRLIAKIKCMINKHECTVYNGHVDHA